MISFSLLIYLKGAHQMKKIISAIVPGFVVLVSAVSLTTVRFGYTIDHGQLQQRGADLVFHNAGIITMDENNPEANAVAITGDRIDGVGLLQELNRFIGPDTKVYNLDGRTVIPGINETHIHVRDLGFQQYYAVNLEPARNISDVRQFLRDRLARLERDGKARRPRGHRR